MEIHDTTIKYLNQSNGLCFKAKIGSQILLLVYSLVYFLMFFCILWKESEYLISALSSLFPIFVFLRVLNWRKNYVKILEDGFEIRDIKFAGLSTILKKYKWKDVEKINYQISKRTYLVVKERNSTKEQSFDITSLEHVLPTQMSAKPSASGLTLDSFIEYIDFVSKENAYSKFVIEKRDEEYEIASEKSACNFILNMACKYNPAARSSQQKILAVGDFQLVDGFDYDDDINGVAHAASLLRTWDWAKRKSFIELLFKLVVTDDGIKNDEWHFVQRLMSHLGFNQKWQDFYNMRYSPLRTETDYKFEEQSFSSSTSSVDALQGYYTLLGLPANATFSQLQAAYHQLAMDNHPDLPKNASRTAECEEYMTKINEAYEALARKLKQ